MAPVSVSSSDQQSAGFLAWWIAEGDRDEALRVLHETYDDTQRMFLDPGLATVVRRLAADLLRTRELDGSHVHRALRSHLED